jgi:hypothetical protein
MPCSTCSELNPVRTEVAWGPCLGFGCPALRHCSVSEPGAWYACLPLAAVYSCDPLPGRGHPPHAAASAVVLPTAPERPAAGAAAADELDGRPSAPGTALDRGPGGDQAAPTARPTAGAPPPGEAPPPGGSPRAAARAGLPACASPPPLLSPGRMITVRSVEDMEGVLMEAAAAAAVAAAAAATAAAAADPGSPSG